MTKPSPLQSLAEHVALLARRPEAVRLAERIAPSKTTGRDAPDLAALLARRDADGRPAIRIQALLAKEAPENPLAALGLLSMLRGDLEVVRDRLVRSGRVSPLDAEADALAAAWEVVTRRPPPSHWERADAIWNLARRVTQMRRQCSVRAEPLPAGSEVAEPERDWFSRMPALLAAAEAAGVLTPREVLLIAWTRIEGWPLSDLARTLGRPYDAAQKERRRAEAALRTYLGRYDSGMSS
jgi:DNA-directed RNA polymerase specialized sigma24 family protein